MKADRSSKSPSIFLLAALTGMTSLSIDMNLPSMPQLQQVFDAGVSAVQLTLSLFLAGFSAGQLVCGPLSDRFGRRPVLLTGLTIFTAAGFVCAMSSSLPMLIGARFVQGFGASVGPIIARAVVRDCFNSRQASAVLSRITQVMIVAPLVALGWSWIFIILGLLGTVLLTAGWFRFSETLPPTDAAGALKNTSIWQDFGAVLSHRASLRHTLTTAFSYAGMFAYVGGSSFVLIDVFKVSESSFGYFFAITAVALMLGASLNRRLVAKVAPPVVLRYGIYLLLTAGILIVLMVFFNIGGLAGILLPMTIYMFGLGLVQPNATSAAMAPHGRLAGLSSSLIGSLQTAGGALTGFCVGAFYNQTPLSLAAVVAVMSVLTWLVYVRRPVVEIDISVPDADLVPEAPVMTGAE